MLYATMQTKCCYAKFLLKLFSAGSSIDMDIVEQGTVVLADVAGGDCLDTLLTLSPSLWETARYRLE